MLNIVEEYIFFKDGRELQEKVHWAILHCISKFIYEQAH
jgi:hypothetical protein